MKQYLSIIAGLLISALFIYLIFTQISIEDISDSLYKLMQNDHYLYIIPGTLIYLLSHVVNAFRWQKILMANDFRKVPIFPLYRIVAMSFMINSLLPARIGEVSKGYFLNKKEKVPLGVAVATVASERFFDMLVVVYFIVISFFTLDIAGNMERLMPSLIQKYPILEGFDPAYALYFVIGFLNIIIIAILIFRKNYDKLVFLIRKILFWLPKDHILFEKFKHFFSDIKFFTHPKQLIEIMIYSIIVWFLYALSFYFFIEAFQIAVHPLGVLFIIGITALAIAIPSAPSGMGVFEFAFAVSIILVGGTNFKLAISCALILHAVQIVTISAIGLYFLIKGNVALKDLTKKEMSEG